MACCHPILMWTLSKLPPGWRLILRSNMRAVNVEFGQTNGTDSPATANLPASLKALNKKKLCKLPF